MLGPLSAARRSPLAWLGLAGLTWSGRGDPADVPEREHGRLLRQAGRRTPSGAPRPARDNQGTANGTKRPFGALQRVESAPVVDGAGRRDDARTPAASARTAAGSPGGGSGRVRARERLTRSSGPRSLPAMAPVAHRAGMVARTADSTLRAWTPIADGTQGPADAARLTASSPELRSLIVRNRSSERPIPRREPGRRPADGARGPADAAGPCAGRPLASAWAAGRRRPRRIGRRRRPARRRTVPPGSLATRDRTPAAPHRSADGALGSCHRATRGHQAARLETLGPASRDATGGPRARPPRRRNARRPLSDAAPARVGLTESEAR